MKNKTVKLIALILSFSTLTCYMHSATDTLSITVNIPTLLFIQWSPSSVSASADADQSSDVTFDTIQLYASSDFDDGYTVQLTSSQASGTQFRLVHPILPADTIDITVYSNQNPEGTIFRQTAIPAGGYIVDVGQYPYSFTQHRTVTIVAAAAQFSKDIAAGLYAAVITATIASSN